MIVLPRIVCATLDHTNRIALMQKRLHHVKKQIKDEQQTIQHLEKRRTEVKPKDAADSAGKEVQK